MLKSMHEIEGLFIGHKTLTDAGTGCSAICYPEGAICAVDVRGGAPATRETDLLSPDKTVEIAHCVMLSGGSAYGLSAASGAIKELEKRNIGIPVGPTTVPIVVSACVFDLMCGSAHTRPTEEDGIEAIIDAFDTTTTSPNAGNTGCGCGCTVAKAGGVEFAMKAGLGEGISQAGELFCACLLGLNALGDIVHPNDNSILAAPLIPNNAKAYTSTASLLKSQSNPEILKLTNTTIGCIVTNAKLTQAQAKRVAIMAHDGLSHTIRPTHTTLDGDALFVLATGEIEADINLVGVLASEAVEQAVLNAVMSATSAYGYPAYNDISKRFK